VPSSRAEHIRQLPTDPVRLAQACWPSDAVTPLLLAARDEYGAPIQLDDARQLRRVTRAATAPADLTTAGWAVDLATGALQDFLQSLAPPAASGELFRRAHMFQFNRNGVVVVPGLVAASTDTVWVKPGDPIPARQLDTSSVASLTPHSAKVLTIVTREMIEGSNAEAIVRLHLGASVGAKIDAALFGSAVATASSPAGLLYGLATLGASSGTAHDAMRLDIGKLIDAVAPVGGNASLVFIGGPGVAGKMLADVGAQFPYPILSSGALAAQTLVCIAADCLAVAVDPNPRIDVSGAGTVTLEDTAPKPIVDGSSVVAPGTRSLWQTDSLAIRLTMQLSFGLRHASGIAMITSCTW
jgi:hypothetical protein